MEISNNKEYSLISYAFNLLKENFLWFIIGSLGLILISTSLFCLGQSIQNFVFDVLSLWMVFAIVFILSIGSFLRSYGFSTLGNKISKKLRKKIFSCLLTLDIESHEYNGVNSLMFNIENDIDNIRHFFSIPLGVLLRNIILFLGGLFFLLKTSLVLTSFILLVIPIALLFIVLGVQFYKKNQKINQKKQILLFSYAREILSSIRTVQIFNYQEEAKKKWNFLLESQVQFNQKRLLLKSLLTSIIMIIIAFLIVILLNLSVYFVSSNYISQDVLVTFIFYVILTSSALSSFSDLSTEFQNLNSSLKNLIELELKSLGLAIKNRKLTERNKNTSLNQINCSNNFELVINKVNFSYSKNPNKLVLSNINLTSSLGEIVAITGPSGSGKSTLLSIIAGFYNLQFGDIFLNNMNRRNISVFEWQNSMSYLSQEPVLFSGSILQNLTFGLEVNERLIWSVIEKVGLKEEILSFPDGIQTLLLEDNNGINLSLGQKQRIALARVLLRNRPLILLDEPTSSLDNISESIIQRELENLYNSGNYLIIVITHRLKTILKSSKIVLLNQGKIEAMGTHKELMNNNEIYKSLIYNELLADSKLIG